MTNEPKQVQLGQDRQGMIPSALGRAGDFQAAQHTLTAAIAAPGRVVALLGASDGLVAGHVAGLPGLEQSHRAGVVGAVVDFCQGASNRGGTARSAPHCASPAGRKARIIGLLRGCSSPTWTNRPLGRLLGWGWAYAVGGLIGLGLVVSAWLLGVAIARPQNPAAGGGITPQGAGGSRSGGLSDVRSGPGLSFERGFGND